MSEYIKTGFISRNLLFIDKDFKCVCMGFYNSKIAKRDDFKYFNCSCSFISDFKRNGTYLEAVDLIIKGEQVCPKK